MSCVPDVRASCFFINVFTLPSNTSRHCLQKRERKVKKGVACLHGGRPKYARLQRKCYAKTLKKEYLRQGLCLALRREF